MRRQTRLVLAALLLFCVGDVASAWNQDGLFGLPDPSGSNVVGECFGNCGAGCSSAWNPCGGRNQYWDLQWEAGPNVIESTVWFVCIAPFELGYIPVDTYEAIGLWTYHGYYTNGCAMHDAVCQGWWDFDCINFHGCGSYSEDRDWTYEQYMHGYQYSGPPVDLGFNPTCDDGIPF